MITLPSLVPRSGRVSLSHPGHRFGGGPAVNHLYVCSICQVEIEALAKRRRIEIDTFIKVRVARGRLCQPLPGAAVDLGTEESCAVPEQV